MRAPLAKSGGLPSNVALQVAGSGVRLEQEILCHTVVIVVVFALMCLSCRIGGD